MDLIVYQTEPGPKYFYKLNQVFDIQILDLIKSNDNNDIVSDIMPVYEKIPKPSGSLDYISELIKNNELLIKNNEKMIDNNTKLVETNAMLSKFVIEFKMEKNLV